MTVRTFGQLFEGLDAAEISNLAFALGVFLVVKEDRENNVHDRSCIPRIKESAQRAEARERGVNPYLPRRIGADARMKLSGKLQALVGVQRSNLITQLGIKTTELV